ncbi:hypothetical protein MNEG_1904 [Monoraphidium neglectum]|uniref:Serine protease n=1 Tax=Monoraphidium neglectum TaxID=145388 RepID=A0A0D2N0I2_9CHLO|nr:hypothetical protein MNEG_1904 [Monoraphidium neglectum]KIZ06057.1 hypothetical protein MNEG_1904 [Monoraphidium neglectum]|eukprot:XP_013905076.1 hypothetical protein MNEG_1904 [Monoraphidium neglectum]
MHATQPLIWTAGHALHFGKDANSSGATSFVARYNDGAEERVSVDVQPVPGIDLMLLKGSKASVKPLEAGNAARGDAVYALGCRAGSAQVSMDRGIVSAENVGAWYVTADADAGWSGGPVVNRQGRLIGLLVQDGEGRRIKSLRVVTSDMCHAFAVLHARPGMVG